MSYMEAKVRTNPALSAPASIPNGNNNANGHPDVHRPPHSASFSPVFGRSTSGSSVTTSSSPSESPQNSPSPGQNSLLNTSNQELFEVGSFSTDININVYDQSDHSGYSKPCNYVSGVRLRTPAEFGRNDHSAVLYEDNMYIYGGVIMDYTLPTSIQIFNFASRSFSTISPPGTTPRYQHSAVVCDNQMIVFGGGAENALLNDLVVFSFESQTWSELVPTTEVRPPARRGHSIACVGKTLFVFGGFGGAGEGAPLNDMYKFDLEQKVWSKVETNGVAPQPRFLHSSCANKNSIWVFGGTNVDYVFGDLFKFNCETNTWEEVVLTDPPNPSPRCSHTAVASQDSMYIVGGSTDGDFLDAHEFFFESKKWYRLELSTQGTPRQGHSAVLRGESIFLFGGITGPNHNQLDLLSLGKDEFEDEESGQIFSQSVPRSMWEAILLKKHPEILQYRELTRNLTGVRTYARSRQSATTEDPAHLNHQLVLNLIVEYLHGIGCSRTANAITEESKVPYFPLSALQPDSRLVMILKVLKSRTKPRNIFDAEFAITSARLPDAVDPEVELVDHMAGAGRVDAQLDGEEDVDIWSESDESRKNMLRMKDENGKSVIRAANLNKLVQVLTLDREKAPDAVYLKTFFYTYQSFTSPEMLLKKLIQKYHVRPEKGVVVDDKYRTDVIEPVQTRVCRVMKFWIEQCPWDFNGFAAEKLLNNLNAFIDGPLSRDGNFNLVKQLRNSISKSLKKKPSADEEKTITAGFNPPAPNVPRNIFSHTLSLKDIDEIEIARQLTLLEYRVFSAITPPEFLSKAWEDPNPKKAPHLKALLARSGDIARWVAYTILKADDKKARSRSKMLEKFIKVADQLRNLKNFQTAQSVITGFTHPAVIRLSQTFGEISPRAKEIYQEHFIFSKDDKPYREIMDRNPLPCIPNMTIALADLSVLHENTPDLLNNLIHFHKRHLIYQHITKFQGFQQRQYNLLPVHQIASLLSKLPKTTDKELEEMSRKCE